MPLLMVSEAEHSPVEEGLQQGVSRTCWGSPSPLNGRFRLGSGNNKVGGITDSKKKVGPWRRPFLIWFYGSSGMCCPATGGVLSFRRARWLTKALHLASPLQLHFLLWNSDLQAARSSLSPRESRFNQEAAITDSVLFVSACSFQDNWAPPTT